MRLVPRIAALALLFAGCRGLPGDSPQVAAYRQFSTALVQGDVATAWSLFSRDTQAELTRQAVEVAKARGLPAPKDGIRVAFGERLGVRHEIKSISVQSDRGDRATLLVSDEAGAEQAIEVVREGDAWRIDLMAEIRKAQSS